MQGEKTSTAEEEIITDITKPSVFFLFVSYFDQSFLHVCVELFVSLVMQLTGGNHKD